MNCAVCGKQFEAKRKTALYCSDACRQRAVRGAELTKPSLPQDPTKPNKPYDRDYHLAAFRRMGLDTVEWLTTGLPDFDVLTQIPRGRVTQIQGPYAVGKTTLALNMIRGLKGVRVLYIDTEAALGPDLLADLDIDSNFFTLYNKSAFLEDIYETIVGAVNSEQYDLVIFDSLAACTFRPESEGIPLDANMGQKAKIMNKLMRIIPMDLKRTRTALLIINQEREVIGGYYPQKYTPGGMAVPYAASLMVALKTTKAARFPKGGPPFTGHEVTATIIKSKVSTPWRTATFKLYYPKGHVNDDATAGRSQPGDEEEKA